MNDPVPQPSSFRRALGNAFPSLLRTVPQPHIALIGGGHGLSGLLSALKPQNFILTAIVAVTDDGGSSGKLQNTFGMIPPGDLRRCLVALSDAPAELKELFDCRFTADAGAALENHPIGNLALAALLSHCNGDIMAALAFCAQALQVRGTVLPVTTSPVRLHARLRNGITVKGEANIGNAGKIETVFLDPPTAEPAPGVLDALRTADLVLIGPGSLYTSLLPPLLIAGVADTLRARTGRTIYLCNPCIQPGETDGYRASDHVRVLVEHIGLGAIRKAVLNEVNAASLPYIGNLGELVESDGEALAAYGLSWVHGELTALLPTIPQDTP